MSESKQPKIKQKGYILVGMLFMMVLIAVSAISLNRKAGMQERMAANHMRTAKLSLGQMAAIEQAAWQLKKTPDWRTDGEDYFFSGVTYTRKVQSSSISGYTDVITITVNAPASLSPITTSFRVNYSQTAPDFWVIADTNNNCIRKVDSSGNITTVAGNGTAGYSGDGGPATSAQLNRPKGVYMDASGNIFIADTTNHRIRKVDASTGNIATVAGNGTAGYSGDGGPATSARLNQPKGVCVDASGNIFIGDNINHRIRKVDASTGNIATVAGNGSAGYSGDGGPATSAKLKSPMGVSVDASGNIFIGDNNNHRIRKVDASTGNITTVAGNGTAGYSGDGGPATSAQVNYPKGVCVDASGNIFIADDNNNRIRKVDASTGNITTVAGNGSAGYSGDGGPATSAKLNDPKGVCVDASGNIFIGDDKNHRIRKVDASTGDITTVAGNGTAGYSGDGGPATGAELENPHALSIYVPPSTESYFLIADTENHRIRKVDAATGIITTVAGTGFPGYSGDGGVATSANLKNPKGTAVDASGNIYIADTENHRIRKVDVSGYITTFAGTGTMGYNGDDIAATSAELDDPAGVSVDASGNIYIADTQNSRIRKVDSTTGIITTVAGNGTVGDAGDGGPATSAELNRPQGIFVDAAGNIYIADTLNYRIRKVDASTQIITTIAGNGSAGFSGDGGVATSAKIRKVHGVFMDDSGNLYIADTDNLRIRKVDGSGTITTVAGTGSPGYNGDDIAATSTTIDKPGGVFLDTAGNLYIADSKNDRIRKVDGSGTITTIAGTGTADYNGDDIAATSADLNWPESIWVVESTPSVPSSSTLEKVSELYWRIN